MYIKILFFAVVITVIACVYINSTKAEEGMWTFDNPPTKLIQEKYGFTPTQEWLDHTRLSCVRFMDGGSGSFVSPNGLVMTNHHVALGQLQKMSNENTDYVKTGFYAKTQEEEIKCADLECNVLISMENVTQRVLASIKPEMDGREAIKAREAEIAKIEIENKEKTGLQCDVVSLYKGGEYWLYRYKKYTDVRLVMAPEQQIAFFGGDDDNFTYPRYDLDFTFFRIYENDKPLKPEHYFKWNSKGASDGELVFVAGNPGNTDRLNTYSELENTRDLGFPLRLKFINDYLKVIRQYSTKGKEQMRQVLGRIFGLENSKKAITGEYNGLLDANIMKNRKKEEDDFRKLISEKPEWKKKYGDLWDSIQSIIKIRAEQSKSQQFEQLVGSQLFGIASTLVRYVVEIKKPDSERLEGYHDSQLERLKFGLMSPAPIYKELEKDVMTAFLKSSLEMLGKDNKFLQIVLKDKTPEEVVANLVDNSQLNDIELRKKLLEGGEKAIKKSKDPMIQLALELDPMMRERIEWSKQNIESKLTPAKEKIASARFEVYGKNKYPDATFTLRLSYGSVKGYPMNGTLAPYKTTLYGLYDRSLGFDNKGGFALPDRYFQRKDQLDLSTPVNFVTTNDIVGGNSGSPVFNKNDEIVGLVFDGNIESLVGQYVFDITANRTVAVHSAFIIEALRKLYDAPKLADEIE
ncbi:MAG: S46 family peptidase [FCB group bacterium]